MIRYHLFETKAQASEAAGIELANTIIEDPTRRIGLATGNSVIAVYLAMITALIRAGINLCRLVTYNLDEWVFEGKELLPKSDIRTFYGFMKKHLFDALIKLGFKLENAHFPSDEIGLSDRVRSGMDLSGYDSKIEKDGGVHTWLVGIGAGSEEHPHEGHVAFGERSHLLHLLENWLLQCSYTAPLEPDTIQNNKDYEGCDGDPSKVPNLAITVAPGTLLRQVKKRLILVAFGAKKAGALRGACELPPHAGCSASVIQLMAEAGVDVDVYMDQEASTQLEMVDRFVRH